MIKVITCVHQSAELYGSDRSFADSVKCLSRIDPTSSTQVILPRPGPLTELLRGSGVKLLIQRLWIPRRVHGLGLLWRLPLLPFAVLRACQQIARSSLVYINTVVVWDYIIAAGLMRRNNVIVHVREIVPAQTLPFFKMLLRFSQATLVFNSEATRKSFATGATKEFVVYNGFRDDGAHVAPDPSGRPLRLLLIGRINSWKGQDLTLEAIAGLPAAERDRLRLRILGGVYEGQEVLKAKLLDLVEKHHLEEIVEFCDFMEDPEQAYKWADVVLVPSRLPEPFGRVAIEGMSFNRPVLGAAHGGLVEIINDNRSGWLFTPNDAGDLQRKLIALLAAPDLVTSAGAAARRRFEEEFTLAQTQSALAKVFEGMLASRH